jgi:hypothetical protein
VLSAWWESSEGTAVVSHVHFRRATNISFALLSLFFFFFVSLGRDVLFAPTLDSILFWSVAKLILWSENLF